MEKANSASADESSTSSSWLPTIQALLWPPSLGQNPVPTIELSIHAPPAFSLSSRHAFPIQLTFVLRSPSIPVTILPDYSIFKTRKHSDTLDRSLNIVNQTSGQKYGRSEVDYTMIRNYRNYELAYRNEHSFLSLLPGVPHTVTHLVHFLSHDPRPLQAGETYRIECAAPEGIYRLWWTYGRKWQVLRWRGWPGGYVPGATYEPDCMGDPPKPDPVPLNIEVVKSCSFRVEA